MISLNFLCQLTFIQKLSFPQKEFLSIIYIRCAVEESEHTRVNQYFTISNFDETTLVDRLFYSEASYSEDFIHVLNLRIIVRGTFFFLSSYANFARDTRNTRNLSEKWTENLCL